MTLQTFQAATKLIWGGDLTPTLIGIISDQKWARIGVVVDAKIKSLPLVTELLSSLGEQNDVKVVDSDVSEPDTDFVDQLTAKFSDHQPDVLIGIGGGSVLDLTKAISVLLTNSGGAAKYQGFNLVPSPGIPTIAVPTTAGTGSEVTWTAVFTNRKKMLKGGINSPFLFPRFALLDPRLTLSMPPRVTFASGMDALSHAVESYTARNASIVSRMFSVKGFRLLTEGLTGVFENPQDLEARRQAQLGSTIAGWGCFNAGTGACHSMAYPLGVHFHVPHGEALSMLLPTVMKINHEKDPETYAALWDDAFPGQGAQLSRVDKSRHLIEHVEQLIARANLKFCLTDYGATETDLEEMSRKALDLKSALLNNPVDFERQDARRALVTIL